LDAICKTHYDGIGGLKAREVLLRGKSLNKESILKSRQESSMSVSDLKHSKANTRTLDAIAVDNPVLKEAVV